VLAGGLVLAACRAFDADPAPEGPPDAAEVDARPIDAPGPIDGGTVTEAGPVTVAPICPAASAPSWVPPIAIDVLRKSTGDVFPFSLVTDSTFVYWVEQVPAGPTAPDRTAARNGGGKGRIMRAPKRPAGSALPVAVELAAAPGEPIAIARDGAYVYWAEYDPVTKAASLRRVLADCAGRCEPQSVPLFVGPSRVNRLVRAGNELFYALAATRMVRLQWGAPPELVLEPAGEPSGAVTDTTLYVSTDQGANVWTGSTKGGSGTSHVTAPAPDGGALGFRWLATDCKSLYAVRDDRDVYQLGLTFPAPPLLRFHLESPRVVYDRAIDARFLYLTSPDGAGIKAIDLFGTGGLSQPPIPIASGDIWGLTVDDEAVYWGDHTSGTIFRARKVP